MDDLLKPSEGSRSVVNLIVGFVGSVSFIKFVSVVANRWMDRGIKRDEYRHEDGKTSEKRAWERVSVVEAECNRLEFTLLKELQEKSDLNVSLVVTRARLESQIDQNTKLCEEIADLQQERDELLKRLETRG